MKIIIYEHISGGGYVQQPIPASVLAEGYAMLRSIVGDFKAAGHEITVLLDQRISKLNPPLDADCTIPIIFGGEPKKFLPCLAKLNDAIYIIAPETAQTLQSLVALAEQTGKASLNSKSDAIAKTADKAVLYGILDKLNVCPKTAVLRIDDNLGKIKQEIASALSFPVVIKPVDGVSCGGLSVVNQEVEVEAAIQKIKAEPANHCFIAQEYITGEAASVSVLSDGKKARAISLNKQNVVVASPSGDSSYSGGIVPFDHPLGVEAFEVAEKAVEEISGLRGYVGVDVVLANDKVWVVDINARLTTSYIGLRKVACFNIAEALIDAVLYGKLPSKIKLAGYSTFSKVPTSNSTLSTFEQLTKMDSVLSPPLPLVGNSEACAILQGNGVTLSEATSRLEQAKKQLITILQ